jgi:hypothetical protein
MVPEAMPSTKSEQDSIKWWVDQQRPGREGRKDSTPAPAAAPSPNA